MSNKKQIIIVDDEAEITEFLQQFVEGEVDADIEVFNDPLKALARLKEKKFDVISLDHRMPGITGMEIVKILRSSDNLNAKSRILLVTGNLEEAECNYMELLNEVVFLEKPIRSQRYLRWIKVLLLNN